LVNCCAPESVTNALPQLVASGADYFGGYANTFQPIPEDWQLEGDKQTDGSLDLRTDLGPARYAEYVGRWLQGGANVVGGCCGTGPAHIRKICELYFSTS
jgi:S-methylmethionine-dependent homocysteine/selenocysteine methylase